MEVAAARAMFRTPQHLAEIRIEDAQSPVAFSAPCGAAGRKRRCLFPAFPSPRKRMLLELAPFAAVPAPSSPAPASGGGDSGSFSFSALPERALTPTGFNGGSGGAFAFLASSKEALTPMGSTASGGFRFLASEPSLPLSPAAFASSASPKPPRTGSNVGGGFKSFGSPEPVRAGTTGFSFVASPTRVFGRAASPASAAAKESAPAGSVVSGGLVSPPRIFSTTPTSASPARKSLGGSSSSLWSRRLARAASDVGRNQDEQLQITLPPRTVPTTEAPPTAATLSAPTARSCCTFLASPAKASNQEAKNCALGVSHDGEPYQSPAPAACCTFLASPARPSSVEKASKQEREVARAPSAAGQGPASPAACTGGEVVVRVTCACGAHKEFCFDHGH